MPAVATREEWLIRATDALRPLFAALEVEVPPIRVSVGWPGGRGRKASTIGQCWPTGLAEDGVAQVFISPVLTDPAQVLATLLHEMVHAADDCQSGHRGAFVRMAKHVGLVGPWTATTAGEELAARLEEMAVALGEYPHAALAPAAAGTKQGTRMLKVVCLSTGYTLRTTAKWLDAFGEPICPCCRETMELSA